MIIIVVGVVVVNKRHHKNGQKNTLLVKIKVDLLKIRY